MRSAKHGAKAAYRWILVVDEVLEREEGHIVGRDRLDLGARELGPGGLAARRIPDGVIFVDTGSGQPITDATPGGDLATVTIGDGAVIGAGIFSLTAILGTIAPWAMTLFFRTTARWLDMSKWAITP